ncbi:biopolymer transporter ExbD [Opitutales bacterium]|jgi:biopolymer transport protein ExbD|nr:biopolymer transporter ExbD [Opitutales bacterium]MDA8990229.1 biopolymer transporter ExbD [Opitutales bacterium]
MKGYEPPQTNDSPDLTPMIDVVFLLIVFFMVVANKISERYMKLEDMPVAKNAKLVETPEPSNMFSVKDSPELGQVPYDGERPIDFSSIPKVILRDPAKPTTVRADGSVPQSVMFDVYRAIGGASQKSKVIINALERPE